MDMDDLAYSDDRNEYYLGKACDISDEAYCNILILLSEVTRNWKASCASGKSVLPKQQKSKAGITSMFLDLKFDVSEPWETEPKKKVKIRIRRDNLFVVAYHDGVVWHWLNDQVDKLNGELKKLNFGGRYESMEKASGKYKESVYVGRNHLHTALRNLHHTKITQDKQKALSVMTIVLTFCEPMRFDSICSEILENWEGSCQLGDLLDRVTEWDTSSTALRDTERLLSEPEEMTEVEKDVKMVLNSSVKEDDEQGAPESSSKKKSKKNKNKSVKTKWG